MEPEDRWIDFEEVLSRVERTERTAKTERRRRRRRPGQLRVAIATAVLMLVVVPIAAGAKGGATTNEGPFVVEAKETGDYALRVRNRADGGAGRLVCADSKGACLQVRNKGGGVPARFAGDADLPPFKVRSNVRVPKLNADLVDGMQADEIIDAAIQGGAGGRPPSGPAGGDLTGSYPDPAIADGVITDQQVAGANVDGNAGVPSLRTLGTGAQQAAAGDDPRFSDARTPTGAAGGDLTGTYPDPAIADGAIDSTDLFDAGLLNGPAGSPSLRSLGTGANEAVAGNDSRLSNSRTPTGSAGGDLTGTYPNPSVADGAITDDQVANANIDGGASVPSLRTLGTGSNQAVAGNDSRLSNSRTPTGSAGGGLTGTYPNPSLANNSVGSSTVSNGSLRIGDIAAFTTAAPIPTGTLPANSCVSFNANVSFDVQDGDVVDVYGDEATNGLTVHYFSNMQDDENNLQFSACELGGVDNAPYGGDLRFILYRP